MIILKDTFYVIALPWISVFDDAGLCATALHRIKKSIHNNNNRLLI